MALAGLTASGDHAREFAHHVMTDDETALPMIARHLEARPIGARVTVVEVESAEDELPLSSPARPGSACTGSIATGPAPRLER